MANQTKTNALDGTHGKLAETAQTGRGLRTRERILDAAEQIFAQKGFAGARIEDFALAVGIRKPSVLHHFDSKDQIYGEVESRIYDQLLITLVGKTISGKDPLDRLFLTIDVALDFIAARPTAGRLLLRTVANGFSRSERADQPVRSLLELWSRRVEEAKETGRLRDVPADLLLVAIGGAAVTFVASHSLLQNGRPDDENLIIEFRHILRALIL